MTSVVVDGKNGFRLLRLRPGLLAMNIVGINLNKIEYCYAIEKKDKDKWNRLTTVTRIKVNPFKRFFTGNESDYAFDTRAKELYNSYINKETK